MLKITKFAKLSIKYNKFFVRNLFSIANKNKEEDIIKIKTSVQSIYENVFIFY